MRTSHRVGVGTVVHERLAVPGTSPGRRRHEYGLYMLLVDLETVEREAVANGDEPHVGRLPSALVPGWLATTLLGAARHPTFEGENEALSRRIRKVLSVQFGAAEAARASSVFLLCVPSVLGLSFNPVSIFLVFDRSSDLIFVVLEVHNTPWDESRAYALRVEPIDRLTSDGGSRKSAMERRYAASWDKDFFVSPFQDSGIGGGDNGVEGNGLALDERTCATSTTVYSWEFRLTHEHEGEATMRKVRGKDTKVKGPHFSRIKIVSRSWRRTSASPFVAGNTSLHDHVTGAAESTKHRCWNFGTEGDKSRLVFRVVLDLELSSQPCTLLRAIAAHPLMPHSMLAYIWLEAAILATALGCPYVAPPRNSPPLSWLDVTRSLAIVTAGTLAAVAGGMLSLFL